MNKRLMKKHKRQVAREKDRSRQTEPDLRTPEQIKAAKDASRPAGGWGAGSKAFYSRSSPGRLTNPVGNSASKTDS
jgi:hypothetical protein